MAFVDDLGDEFDDVSSDDCEGEIFDVEAEGDGPINPNDSVRWLNFDQDDSSSYFDGE
jgi:hypothetical protein